ncbi:MAG: peptidoglycan bridge formation glycyltransferase FemA/FemB family protein [Confluentibacter sp.]|nr:peptidoglycan bridge formation glycyltransferase FemA/FemB family protein [Confluentibacter sp.]
MTSKAENKTPLLLKYEENDVLIAIPLLVRKIPNTKYVDATSVYGYAGPISKGITATFDPSNFNRALMEYFSKNNYVSVFSRLNPFIENQCALLSNLGIIQNQGKIVNIDLNLSLEDQRSSFRNRLKTHINKSRRLCTVRKAETIADIKSYIDIYHENMDRVKAKKLYYFDEAYFENLLKSTNYKSTILLAIEKETGQIIAGSMFFITNGIVQYHLSGTKNGFLHLTPTKLLIDEMRIIATNNGCKFFNLGGGLGGRDDDSLFDFKSSFSKDFKEFKLWKYIVKQDVYDDLVAKKGVPEDSDFFPLYRSLDDLNINL